MPKISKVDLALQAYQETQASRYFEDVTVPRRLQDGLADLEALAILAEMESYEGKALDEAERVLLRLIGDADVARAFYQVRKRVCL